MSGVPPASEAAVIREALKEEAIPDQQRRAALKELAALEARVEVELELRKAAYERIAALEARLAEALEHETYQRKYRVKAETRLAEAERREVSLINAVNAAEELFQ